MGDDIPDILDFCPSYYLVIDHISEYLCGSGEYLLMDIILYELVEDVVVDEELVKLLLLLLVVGFRGAYCQIVKVLQGDHLFLEVLLYEFDTYEFTDFVEHVVFGTDGVGALADALGEVEDDLQLH